MNRDDDRAVYRQIADELRAALDAGTYEPGARCPSAAEIAKEYGVHRDTARAALRVLAHEGRLVTYPRAGTVVTGDDPQMVVELTGPARITARMPSDVERREMGLPHGVAFLLIERPAEDGEGSTWEQHPSHTTTLQIG